MKVKKLNTKLTLNKKTIVHLSEGGMKEIHGGDCDCDCDCGCTCCCPSNGITYCIPTTTHARNICDRW
ncbi:MAG: hypothetical protein GY765_01850 [bacterium]|nr:hypothetical protein [bacterium]